MSNKLFLLFFCIILALFNACENQKYDDKDETAEEINYDPEKPPIPGISSLSIMPGKLIPEFMKDIPEYTLIIESAENEIELQVEPLYGSSVQVESGEFITYDNYSIIPVNKIAPDILISASNNDGEEKLYRIIIKRLKEIPVANYSFEEFNDQMKPYDWNMASPGNILTEEGISHTGSRSAYFSSLTASISGREIVSSPVEIVKGVELIISAWVYLPVSEQASPDRVSLSLKIYYYKDYLCETPASSPYSTMFRISPDDQGQWEKIRWERRSDQIPADAEFIRIAIRACYNKDKGGTKDDRIYFDSTSIQQ